ncbi:eCIS core domain-containing protein [Hyalangium rubrum]|uniref:DUF4157 domain-containing protein n=1 Tax=Hyalangium rubrum TaxID=3103134 RepID=A0ABU5HE99_9BACT|nr:DUF4157 domain-containing protein [Hyalangium sp. s54d21]MDY7231444.1 DUF4157 domain-containing protein [Hyalangium sp. s54d21]
MGAKLEPPETNAAPAEPSKPSGPIHLVNAAASSAQKLPDTRPLSEVEVQLLRKVFDAGLKYPPLRLTRMGSFTELINGSRAFTLGNTIHLPSKAYSAISSQYPSLLVHEAVHVWQYQRDGWGYVPNALWAQTGGDGYDFAKPLRQGKAWRRMNPEQQGQMIQDAYRGAWFEAPGALFGLLQNDKPTVIRPGSQPPDGFADFTYSLVAALEILRKP